MEQEEAAPLAPAPVEPAHLLCPVTREIMRDPVFTSAGHTYERAALVAAWRLARPPFRDPLTNDVLATTALTPNWAMRSEACPVHTPFIARFVLGRH